MNTYQTKVWSGLSPTPNKGNVGSCSNPRNGDKSIVKGKDVVGYIEGRSPPLNSLGENRGMTDGGGTHGGDAEVWRRFKEEGLLDKASLERKDREALVEKILKAEKELFDYQYNMGLLLIEKKKRTSEYDELRQALAEARASLKRQQAAHLIALSEVEKREDNLRSALGIEKQCVADLEKAFHEMHKDSAEVKLTFDKKMGEANDLVASMEEKSLDVKVKLHSADAKLAEVSINGSEVGRKLKEVEVREHALQSEHPSLNAELEMHEVALHKQREELQEWERMIQEREEKKVESRRIPNQKEEKANGNEITSKQKEKDLKEAQRKIEMAKSTLEKKEDDINIRLASLAVKEEEIGAVAQKLEMKEKDLLALEEKLDARDMEVQKFLDEHNFILGSRKHEFEMEIDQKRTSVDEDYKSKIIAVEQKEIDSIHKDEKIGKREQALAKKLEKCKEKEKDIESKRKALREREKSLKVEEKDLAMEKKQMVIDRENLQILNFKLVKERTNLEEKQLQLRKEIENLKVIERERSELHCLQAELKQKRDKCVLQEESILKEREDLKLDRENFEKEWEILDEKRSEVAKELKQLSEEKKKLEQLKHTEEERLKHEKLVTQDNVQRELEALRLEKESLLTYMEHERSVFLEQVQSEHDRMLQDLELQKAEVEADMEKMRKMESHLWENVRAFENQKERELKHINYLKEVAGRELTTNKKHLEDQQVEIRKDIDKLDTLVKKLKDQREQCKIFVDKLKSCKSCGEVIDKFILSDLQTFQEMDDADVLPFLAKDYLKERTDGTLPVASDRQTEDVSLSGTGLGSISSGGNMSWLRKCTSKIFNVSPLKRSDHAVFQGLSEELPVPITQVDREASKGLGSTENRVETYFQLTNSVGEFESEPTLSVDAQSNMDSKAHEVTDTYLSELKSGRGKPGMKRRPRGKKTRPVKAVFEDAKVTFGGSPEENNGDEHPYGNREDNIDFNGGKPGALIFNDKGTATGRKRSHAQASRTTSEQDADNSEAHSDSATTGGRRKRQQTVVLALETPGGNRYNLRRPKTVGKAAAGLDKGKRKVASKRKTVVDSSLGVANENGKSAPLMQMTTLTSIVEVNELPLEKFVRFGTSKTIDSDNAFATKLVEDKELSEGVNGSTEAMEYVDDNEYGSEVSGEFLYGDDDEEDEDYDCEHPDEVSIGKKLWTFFTT